MKLLLTLFAFSLFGCAEGSLPQHEDSPPQHGLAPVIDANAPLVGDLIGSGLVIVDMNEVACDAGPDVYCTGADALFLGRASGPDDAGVVMYECPGTNGPSDNWKCREVADHG